MKDLLLLMNEIKPIVNKTSGLNITEYSSNCINIRNSRLYWRKAFERRIKSLCDKEGIDLLYSSSFGGCDYLIVNKNSL